MAEVPSEWGRKCTDDLLKVWTGALSELRGQLHRQERNVLERLERLECLVRQGLLTTAQPLLTTAQPRMHGGDDACNQISPEGKEAPSDGSKDKNGDSSVLHEVYDMAGNAHFQSMSATSVSHGDITVVDDLFDGMSPSKTTQAFQRVKTLSFRLFPAIKTDSFLARIVSSLKFSMVVSLVICLNAFTIGLHANWQVGEQFAQSMGRPSAAMSIDVPEWTNIVFAVFFFFECGVRIYTERSNFIFGPLWRWNAFDVLLVLAGIAEVIADTASLSYIRTIRVLRMVHVLQVIRVLRVFDVLRHMVFAILGSLLSLFWIILVLALMLYVYGVYLVSVVGDHVKDSPDVSGSIGILNELFGTLSRAMLSVFEGVTGGRNYHEIIAPLLNIHWMHGVAFLMFFIFFVLGVLNIVTGIFVERATELAKLDSEMIVMNQLDAMHAAVSDLKAFFQVADSDCNGKITWDEFHEQLQDPKVRAYFMTMGIDVQSAVRVFQMLDRHGRGSVEVADFVEGCIRLKGAAKSIDVCMLLLDVRRLRHMLEVFMQYTEDEMGSLRSALCKGSNGASVGPTASKPPASINQRLTAFAMRRGNSFHSASHIIQYSPSLHSQVSGPQDS